MDNPQKYAKELAKLLQPFIDSCLKLRKDVKFNLDSKQRLNWKKVEQSFYEFEDQLNKFLGAE